ncbi:MAG TPA: hypothetical protein VLR91_03755 [Thermodesulfobacteriota bacterium]|nr:hypothetical protein [Thermodesulfobacteriota bacterium]
MTVSIPQSDLQQDCLDKLGRALDLVLKTAEAASAENNHKIVIQAAREVTRIATLITKMTSPKNQNARSISPEDKAPAACQTGRPSSRPRHSDPPIEKNDFNPDDLILPDLDTFFSPHEVASWDEVTQGLYKNISKNYQELQTIGAEMAAGVSAGGKDIGNNGNNT